MNKMIGEGEIQGKKLSLIKCFQLIYFLQLFNGLDLGSFNTSGYHDLKCRRGVCISPNFKFNLIISIMMMMISILYKRKKNCPKPRCCDDRGHLYDDKN